MAFLTILLSGEQLLPTIAKSLGATSPLFVLPLAFFIGEKISLRAILGVLVAIAGVGLLFISR